MANSIKGSTVYKKKEGLLSISKDQKSILWSSSQGPTAAPALAIAVAHVSNLQQTPETAPKVMLKIFEKSPDAPEAVTHLFHFNSVSNARGEANAIKDILTNLISAAKAADASLPRANGTPVSAVMAVANAVSSKPMLGTSKWYDDAQLKSDIELQQSLMKKDPSLHRTYMESRRTKPDSISDSQFNSQFWSTRTNMLRSHAVETTQRRGTYNILSAVKPRQVDGELKMNISAEQVQLIFNQHPLVKRIYDENVPKLNEMEFWSRFFLSRLFKKLKGERILETDSTDPCFDRYLDSSNETGLSQRLFEMQIPHIIDLEGNEENEGGKKSGNKKDMTMRPTKVPIVRILNSLSEKIMAQVAPSDIDPSNPIGMDEETFNSLALRDLQGDAEESRIMLKIKEQSRFFSNEQAEISAEAARYSNQIPAEVLSQIRDDVNSTTFGNDPSRGLDLHTAIGVLDDSDSDDEGKIPHVGSKASIAQAQKQILRGVIARRAELDGSNSEHFLSGLSQRLFDRLTLTQSTTINFLQNFWSLFLSGDPDRANELAQLAETLDRAMDRISAVASDAEKEKDEAIRRHKQHIRDVYEKSGKKIQWNPNSVGGGQKVVNEMMEPTIKTIQKATKVYRRALADEGIDTA